jgi:hypothetical protein
MQPTIVARPFHVEGFVYEENVNRYRIVAYKHGRGGEEEEVMSADNRRIDGSNDDFALLRRLLAEAVEEGRLKIIDFDAPGEPLYEGTGQGSPPEAGSVN